MYSMQSPNQIKRGFNAFVGEVERGVIAMIDEILGERLAAVFVKEHKWYIDFKKEKKEQQMKKEQK